MTEAHGFAHVPTPCSKCDCRGTDDGHRTRHCDATQCLVKAHHSQVVIASGFAIPFGLAIDQTGHLTSATLATATSFKSRQWRQDVVASLPGGSHPVAVDSSGTCSTPTPSRARSTISRQVAPSRQDLAGLLGVYGLATESLGDLFVSSYNDSTVTEISPNGTQTSIGSFGGPWGLAVDAQDDLYVADYNDGTVWKVTPEASARSSSTDWRRARRCTWPWTRRTSTSRTLQ